LGIEGIAYASVASQWIGVVIAVALLLIFFRRKLQRISVSEIFDVDGMKRFFKVNGDIVVRTFCNVCVYTFFTAASARMGNAAILAVNTILMQLLMLFSYMNDGFAYAAEAMTGRFIGAKDLPSLKKCLRYCSVWTFVTAIISIVLYLAGWRELFTAFLGSASAQELADVLAVAREYLWWIVIIPIFAALPFMLDGVMAGATLTRVMRNTMIVAASIFFGVFFALKDTIGNDALWLAFTLYIVLRLILQYFMSDRLRDIYRQIENFAK
jgi:MATE family multidrug resistance protein